LTSGPLQIRIVFRYKI